MNKRAAKAKAQEGKLTIGELRKMIASRRGFGGMSAVNGAIPLERVLEIYDAALAGRPEEEVPKAWRTDPYTGREKPSADVLIITNILRDCA